ncbi:Sex combs reduced scr-like protein [Daphnia magna]|uniref:Sex combs reduced scr-like protein n=1 Tax=Daphnia magna TaxID=35525 RepID=A0A164V4J0_9CRUS|nr:Sex combs reduced scr-like protein [Daphnia magna]
MYLIVLVFGPFSRCQRTAASRPPDVHALPDAGTGERVPHKSLPDEEAADRNGPRPMPDRAPDQNLVPKPTHEAQERDPGHQGAQRARQSLAYQRWNQLQFVQRIYHAQRRRLRTNK